MKPSLRGGVVVDAAGGEREQRRKPGDVPELGAGRPPAGSRGVSDWSRSSPCGGPAGRRRDRCRARTPAFAAILDRAQHRGERAGDGGEARPGSSASWWRCGDVEDHERTPLLPALHRADPLSPPLLRIVGLAGRGSGEHGAVHGRLCDRRPGLCPEVADPVAAVSAHGVQHDRCTALADDELVADVSIGKGHRRRELDVHARR